MTRTLSIVFALLTASAVYASWTGLGVGHEPVEAQPLSVRDDSVGGPRALYRYGK